MAGTSFVAQQVELVDGDGVRREAVGKFELDGQTVNDIALALLPRPAAGNRAWTPHPR